MASRSFVTLGGGARHTIATWLKTKGYLEWERAVVLDHSGSGSVTENYSHGHPTKLKLKLLKKWADRAEELVRSNPPTGDNVVQLPQRAAG